MCQTYAKGMNLNTRYEGYVNWFNNHRIHFSLGYLTPIEYRMNTLKKLFSLLLTIQFVLQPKKYIAESLKILIITLSSKIGENYYGNRI